MMLLTGRRAGGFSPGGLRLHTVQTIAQQQDSEVRAAEFTISIPAKPILTQIAKA